MVLVSKQAIPLQSGNEVLYVKAMNFKDRKDWEEIFDLFNQVIDKRDTLPICENCKCRVVYPEEGIVFCSDECEREYMAN